MNLRLDQPWWFLLVLLIVPMAWAAIACFRAMSGVRRWSSVVFRLGLLVLLATMLAGLSFIHETRRVAVVAVVDISGSLRQFLPTLPTVDGKIIPTNDAIVAFLQGSSRNRRVEDLTGIVIFDAKGGALQGLGARAFGSIASDVAFAEGSDLEQALELGAAMLPADAVGRIVLFSDGVETSGSALRAARKLSGGSGVDEAAKLRDGRRVPVDVVPLNYAVTNEVIVESLDSPPTVAGDKTTTVPLRVVLMSAGTNSGTLQILHDGEAMEISGGEAGRGLRLTLPPGRHVQEVRVPLGQGRVHRFEAVWEPDAVAGTSSGNAPGAARVQDTVLTNNRASSFTVAPGKGAVLVVDGVSGGRADGPGAVLPSALRSAGIDVQVLPAESVQSDLLWLQAFDLVILQNVAADGLSRATHDALAAYVTQLGGGLLMVGGPESFGAGGWKGSAIEPLLPVQLDLPERLVTPAAAIVIIIDNSGSMNRSVVGGDKSQQQIANEGAALAVMSMDKSDLVGVISFNDGFDIQVPMQPNADAKRSAGIIRKISADGGTNLPPALQEAHRMLKGVNAEVKHVIVLSDGVSMGAEMLPGRVQEMRSDDIRVSAIAVGDGADTKVMAEMANIGKGQFYRVTDPTLLPRIFLKAVRVVRTPQIREVPFVPLAVGVGSPVLEGLVSSKDQALPALGGLVLTQPRLEPTVVSALITPNGEPVLSYWNAGIGRVGAFTSDAHQWAMQWRSWSGYSKFWTQLVRQLARPPTNRSQVLTLDFERDRMTIRLDATDDQGKPLDLLTVPVSVYSPDGTRMDAKLSQVGSGQYQASVPVRVPGTFVVTAQPRFGNVREAAGSASSTLAPIIGGISRPPGEEYRRLTSNPGLLRQIAMETGGREYSISQAESVNLFDRANLKPAQSRQPLFPYLALAAVVVLLLDVATRRIAWDRLLTREFGSQIGREATAAMRDRGRQAEAALGRLRQTDVVPAAKSQSEEAERGALGDDDAQRIVREQAERRKLARDAARAKASSASVSTQPEQTAAPSVSRSEEKGQADESETGLQAAKRRARRRMDSDES